MKNFSESDIFKGYPADKATPKMTQSDFVKMVRSPNSEFPLIPNLARAVEEIKRWRKLSRENPDEGVMRHSDQLFFLTNVMKKEIKRQGFKERYSFRAETLAEHLHRAYIVDLENHGGKIGQWFYKHFPEYYS